MRNLLIAQLTQSYHDAYSNMQAWRLRWWPIFEVTLNVSDQSHFPKPPYPQMLLAILEQMHGPRCKPDAASTNDRPISHGMFSCVSVSVQRGGSSFVRTHVLWYTSCGGHLSDVCFDAASAGSLGCTAISHEDGGVPAHAQV